MKRDYFGWAIVGLAFFTMVYLVNIHQRFLQAKEVQVPIVSKINKNFKSFGFDYSVKVYAYKDFLIPSKSVAYYYDKVYFPESLLKNMNEEKIARYILDVAPCQFTSDKLAVAGTKETRPDKRLFVNQRPKPMSLEEIKEVWNKGSITGRIYGRNLSIEKIIPASKANINSFFYFDPVRYESEIRTDLDSVMIESFKDKALIKIQNDNCLSRKI